MKAIILVAGEGTRMYPLTYTKPKPLLKIANRPILEHTLERIKANGISEVILIVGYRSEQIKKYFGESFHGIRIRYVAQKEQMGTGHALLQARDFVGDEKFLAIYGDDYYDEDDIRKCLKEDVCVSAKEVSDPERFGVFIIKNNIVQDIIEKPKEFVSNLANTGLYVLDKRIFKILERIKKSPRGEIELPEAVKELSSSVSIPCVITNNWIPIGYPWELLNVNELFMKDIEDERESSDMEKNVTIVGNVRIGSGTKIKSGAYIEGPVIIGNDCIIGPNCFIRPGTAIGNGCKIGNAVEIKNSMIGDNTNIEHLSYVGDSIIGDRCNFGAGTIVANLRHDNKTVKVLVKGELVDTMRRKFGAVLADYTKTGIKTSIYPGTMLGPFSWTVPNSAVNKNLEPFHLLKESKSLIDKEKLGTVIKNSEELKDMERLYDELKDMWCK